MSNKWDKILFWALFAVLFAFGVAMVVLGSVEIAYLGRLNDEYTLEIVIIWFGVLGLSGSAYFLWALLTQKI